VIPLDLLLVLLVMFTPVLAGIVLSILIIWDMRP
jgi:hypothetical protein